MPKEGSSRMDTYNRYRYAALRERILQILHSSFFLVMSYYL